MVGIDNKEKYKKLLTLLRNNEFQEKVLEFRLKWEIPPQGFENVGEQYKEWLLKYFTYAESITYGFDRIVKRCRDLYSPTDNIFPPLLSLYVLFNKFPTAFPNDLHIPSSIPKLKPSGVLGYVDVIFTLPLFFSFESVNEALKSYEGLIRDVSSNISKSLGVITESELDEEISQEAIDRAFLRTTPGNPADIVAKNQEDLEWLMEYGRALLNESVSHMTSFDVKTYQDKNRHIDSSIQNIGMWLSNRGLHNATELFWQNITDETEKISKERGIKLNRGISLGNMGIHQIAQGKVRQGVFNLYRAFEDDREVLEDLNDPNSDPEKNIVTTVLYTQFEDQQLAWYQGVLLPQYLHLIDTFPTLEELKKIVSTQESSKRLHLFSVLSDLREALEQESILSNFISRGHLIDALSDLSLWIEDAVRRKDNSKKDLYQGLNFLKFQSLLPQGFVLGSETLDELEEKINLVKTIKNITSDQVNAISLILIRNYSGHNFDSNLHDFFSNAQEYISRIIFTIIFLFRNRKI